jgi:CheY-like chemotaxis protein
MDDEDDESDDDESEKHGVNPWKVMIVDDEPEIHNVTKLALSSVTFEGRGLEFVDANSGAEAKQMIEEHPDTALILLDVVMEDDDSGLQVVKHIREVLKNRRARIILRTGQPGHSPEEEIIVNYDINDYKSKTELTTNRLFTTVIASLRAYQHIAAIEESRVGLRNIIEALASIFKLQSMEKALSGILGQMVNLLQLGENSLYFQSSGFISAIDDELTIRAGSGTYSECVENSAKEILSPEVFEDIQSACRNRESQYKDKYCVMYFRTENGSDNLVYVESSRVMDEADRELLEVFCENASVALDHVYLMDRQ